MKDSETKAKDVARRGGDAPAVGRRNFLKGATLAGAAALTPTAAANAVPAPPQPKLKAALPRPRQMAVETQPPSKDPVNQTSSGGDFMVDVFFKSLDVDYLAMNCASSFRGLHEAVINYGNNTKPEILNCPHEDIAVHMAQGYAKMAGKPIGHDLPRRGRSAARHHWQCTTPGAIGCRSSSWAATSWRRTKRAPGRGMGALGGGYQRHRAGLHEVGRFSRPRCSTSRRLGGCAPTRVAMTPPMGPVMLALDAELQEEPDPRRGDAAHPQAREGDPAAGGFGARSRSLPRCW